LPSDSGKTREQRNLRELVEDEAARRGVAPRKLWEQVLGGIVRDALPPILPEGISLDTQFNHGGMPLTLRRVIAGRLKHIERYDPSGDGWAKTLMFDPAAFGKWLDEVQPFLTPNRRPYSPPKPQRHASRRDAALEAMTALYPDKRPLGSIKTITSDINLWLAQMNGGCVSEDTVSRALKRFRLL
jgi:hypothetical protein